MEVLGLFYLPTWIVYMLATITLYLLYSTWHFNVFKNQGIDGPKPIPLLGNLKTYMTDGSVKGQIHIYERFKEKGIYGFFEGRVPIYFISKPEYIREVMVKQFESFMNRRVIEGHSDEKPLDTMLLNLKGDHWKYVRNIITPTFSTKKLKMMIFMMNESADSLVKSLETKVDNKEDVNIKNHMGNFTLDVISRTAFGVNMDAQNDPENPFIKSAKAFTDFSFTSLFFILYFFFPFLTPLVKLKQNIMAKKSVVFIESTKENIKFRQQNPSNYADLLQAMLDTRKTTDDENNGKDTEQQQITSAKWTRKTGLTDDEILAQAVLFFLAGYETTANMLTFTLYNLAIHPSCCDKVLKEIDSVLGEKEPDYDTVNNMPYLQMCLSETLRLYPAAYRLDRVATKDVVVGGKTLPKGAIVAIPAAALHRDQEYWDDPEAYDPERFTTENKAKRTPFVYLPFGDGPRNCIGMRLAYLEAKIALTRILQKFRPQKCDKTMVPLKLPKKGNFPPEEGVWVRLVNRN